MDNNEKRLKQYKIEHLEIDNFFDCMSDLLLKLSNGKLYKSNDFDKHFSPYMVCRYLSMNKNLLPYAEYLNTVQMILDKKCFVILYSGESIRRSEDEDYDFEYKGYKFKMFSKGVE